MDFRVGVVETYRFGTVYSSIFGLLDGLPIYCFPILLISGKGVAIAKKTAIATLVFGYCHTGVSLTDENSVAIASI